MTENDNRDLGGNLTGSDKPIYQPRYDNSYAIVVGIDTYKDPKLRPLGKAEEDARNMNEVLSGDPYNFQVELLLGQKATRRAITRALNKIISHSHMDDRVIFYFAGHGYIVQNNRGFDIGYLACADTDPDDPFDGLEYDEVIKLTQFAKAKHIAYILDACFSGNVLGLTRSVAKPAAVQEYLLHTAYQVLTAGGVEVVSDARSMTDKLISIFRDANTTGQEIPFTFSHLGQQIHDVIHNQSRGRQSPIYGYLEGSSKGQMVLREPIAEGLSLTTAFKDRFVEELVQRFDIEELRFIFFNQGFPEYYVNWNVSLYDVCLDILRIAQEKDFIEDFLRAAVKDRPNSTVLNQLLTEFSTTGDSKIKSSSVQRTTVLPETESTKSVANENEITKRTQGDPILDILPPPFEWCDIPAGRVTLEEKAGTFDVKSFKMAKYPITYAQYQVFIDASDGLRDNRWWKNLSGKEAKPSEQKWKISTHPRENVSWYAAVAFCRWLSYRVRYEVRLPTEWEWQWAAHGPDGIRYPWGNEYIYGNSNVLGERPVLGKFSKELLLATTTPVDQYPQGASPFGVMDMVGNVEEWCMNEYEKPDIIDLAGDAQRVLRGGGWVSFGPNARCAWREGVIPKATVSWIGFRIIQSLANST